MRHELLKHWVDISNAVKEVSVFINGRSFEDYKSDRMLQVAIERELEIVGEALHRMEDIDKSALGKVLPEYRKIIGLRNVLAHGYDTIDHEIIWDLVKNKVPELDKIIFHQIQIGKTK